MFAAAFRVTASTRAGARRAIASVVGVDVRLLTQREARKTHVKPVGAHGWPRS
jgi:hypothetical protein